VSKQSENVSSHSIPVEAYAIPGGFLKQPDKQEAAKNALEPTAQDVNLALREGNAIYRIKRKTATIHHLAGTGELGYSGDGGPARLARLGGPKGLACSATGLYVADTENHVIRRIEITTGIITTVLGTGHRGDGPESDPLRCALSRPHGVLVDAAGVLYVGDSEAHRIRVVH
jgi:sugar lactone lactonase YvrE